MSGRDWRDRGNVFFSAISVHNARDIGDGDEVGSTAENAVGDRVHSVYGGAFGALHVEGGFAVFGLILLFPLILQLDTARSDYFPVKEEDQYANDDDTTDNSSSDGADVGAGVVRAAIIRCDASCVCASVARLRYQ